MATHDLRRHWASRRLGNGTQLLHVLLVIASYGCGEPPETALEVVRRLIPLDEATMPANVPKVCTVDDEIRPALGCVPIVPLGSQRNLRPEKLTLHRRYVLPSSIAGHPLVAEPVWLPPRRIFQMSNTVWKTLPRKVVHRPGKELEIAIELPPDAARGRISVGVQARPIPPPTQTRSTPPVTIPPGAVLAIGTAIDPLGTDTDAAPVEFRLVARSPAGEHELMQIVMDPADASARGWTDHRLDLAALVGQSVQFVLSTRVRPRPGQPVEEAFSFPLWGPANILAPRPRGRNRNVLLVSIDTLRADHLSSYGFGLPTTPELDRLAAEGALFEETLSPYPSTTAAHMSMLTGFYPSAHGVLGPTDPRLPREIPTLAEILAEQGYQTAAVTEGGMLGRRMGFPRSVSYYRENIQTDLRKGTGQVDVTFTAGLDWLRRHRGERFFLFLHTYQVHWPYVPPPAFKTFGQSYEKDGKEIKISPGYVGGVRYTDSEIRRLLDGLSEIGEAENTIVVVTSDHGEGFPWGHGWAHGFNLYDEALRVPLIMRAPGLVPAGVRVKAQVSLVDLVPTLLDLLDIPTPKAVQGKSLIPLLHDPDDPGFANRAVFAEVRAGSFFKKKNPPLVAVRTTNRKWIFSEDPSVAPEVYDPKTDPDERHNLANPELLAEGEALVESYRTLLARSHASLGSTTSEPEDPLLQTEERDLEKLRALGYIE